MSVRFRSEGRRLHTLMIRKIDMMFPQWKPIVSNTQWYGEVLGPIKAMIRDVCAVEIGREAAAHPHDPQDRHDVSAAETDRIKHAMVRRGSRPNQSDDTGCLCGSDLKGGGCTPS